MMFRSWFARPALAATVTALIMTASPTLAESVTACTLGKVCYCVESGLSGAINEEIGVIWGLIAKQRSQGKAVGYMSVPLSTVEGSYFPLNVKVAARVKERVEERLGVRSAWLLNPGAPNIGLPGGAHGAEYMLMWTRVLEGSDGLAPDFDFVYFVGPGDFAQYLGLDGRGDLEKLEAYYDGLAKTDEGIRAVDKIKFRNYYGLRASVSFSLGSHDEWNIVRAINQRRREAAGPDGIVKQLAVYFDGHAVPPGMFEAPVADGYVGACKPK